MKARWAESLVAGGLLSREELLAAERLQGERGLRLEEAVVALGALSEDQVVAAVAEERGLAFVFPYAGAVEPRLVARFPQALLRRLDAVPLHEEEGAAVIAFGRAPEAGALEELARAGGGRVRAVMAAPRRIHVVLDELGARRRGAEDEGAGRARLDPAALKLLFGTLVRGLEVGASEVRFDPVEGPAAGGGGAGGGGGSPSPGGAEIAVRMRVGGGTLEELGREPVSKLPALAARARILAGEPGGGAGAFARRLRTEVGGRAIDLDIAVLPARGGEAVRVGIGRPPAAGEVPATVPDDVRARFIEPRRGYVEIHGDAYRAAARAYAIGRLLPAESVVVCLERFPLEREPRFVQAEAPPGADLDELVFHCLAQAPDALYVGERVGAPAAAALEDAAHDRLILVRAPRGAPERAAIDAGGGGS